jgi:hypothetical protein
LDAGRVVRGGSWFGDWEKVRVSNRARSDDAGDRTFDLGLRLAQDL